MDLVVKRFLKTNKSTIGKLYVDGTFECYTLEDIDRNLSNLMTLEQIKELKIYGNTAIPRGKYALVVQQSPSNGKRYFYLQNVKGYTGVRIEWGNTQMDTLGCILVGTTYTTDKVNNSVVAYNALVKKMNATKGHTITIMDEKNISNSFWVILVGILLVVTYFFRVKVIDFFKKLLKK
ncbi:DUF5675 family protein [Arcicella lustrica]|uniref:DUF5675 family protein n=1 Tax=Arcicella lustrica TaxID=2984196 RepID=A0ABU5SDR8_9BACT|nr:DUF5675 family protein [Arcicella sp. DC25W]MEA5425391.1 DUF5675 family protein [Arcicella sp. DC25W]